MHDAAGRVTPRRSPVEDAPAAAWAGRHSHRVTVLADFARLGIALAEFHCAPDDVAWRQANDVGGGHHVVFPGTSVVIARPEHGPLVADPTVTVLYNPHERFRRRLVDPRGDHCLLLLVHPELLGVVAAEQATARRPMVVAAAAGASGRSPDAHVRFSTTHRRVSPTCYLLVRLLHRHALDPRHLDPLVLQEGLVQAAREALLPVVTPVGTSARRAAPQPRRGATRVQHHAVAAAALEVLAARVGQRLSLADLADEVGASPYHLHRLFRAQTGQTVHAHREQLRVRVALQRVLDGEDDLARLAADLGYASHSHLTDRFRRTFGVTPSHARRLARAGGLPSRH